MAEHPIHGLMREALHSLKQLVEVNTVIGDPIELPDGDVIIPVSRVSLGFAAGGSEFGQSADRGRRSAMEEYGMDEGVGSNFPFGGGSGAGISVQPVGFLVVARDGVRMLSVDGSRGMERILDIAPRLLERLAEGARSRAGSKGGEGPAESEGEGYLGPEGPEAGPEEDAGGISLRKRLTAGAVRNRLRLSGGGSRGEQGPSGGASGKSGNKESGRSGAQGWASGAGRSNRGSGRQERDGSLNGDTEGPDRDRAARVVRTVTELLESAERRHRGRS